MSFLFRAILWISIIGGAIGAIIYYGYADVWVVPDDDPRLSASVQPTLRSGDLVLVQRHGLPSVGNLVRCEDPDEPRRWVVGRWVASTGTVLHVTAQSFSTPGSRPHNDTTCDKQRLVSPATGDEVDLSCYEEAFAGTSYQVLQRSSGVTGELDKDVAVLAGKGFLMSDNRSMHLDSRDYGQLTASTCHHIIFRLWGSEGFGDASRRFNIVW